MAINKRIELEWNGESCSVLVTMEVIERLEERVNLIQMASDLGKGNAKLSQAARLISMLLAEGGIKVTSDEIWEEIFSDKGANAVEVVNLMSDILSAVFPTPKKSYAIEQQQSKIDIKEGYPWDTLYQLMVAEFSIAPSEYWKMTPAEVALVLDSKRPKTIGGIHEDDFADMLQRRNELESKGVQVI